jgi:hypothetical protein
LKLNPRRLRRNRRNAKAEEEQEHQDQGGNPQDGGKQQPITSKKRAPRPGPRSTKEGTKEVLGTEEVFCRAPRPRNEGSFVHAFVQTKKLTMSEIEPEQQAAVYRAWQ